MGSGPPLESINIQIWFCFLLIGITGCGEVGFDNWSFGGNTAY